ncbi:MAG: hypothetical protein FWG26_10210 [Betaproteobacteria bacterium]|nr:hypothetical protein [Betaproteobacteria bacterium]
MNFPRTVPFSAEPGSPSPSLLMHGAGARMALAAVACGLLWLVVLWALA